MERAVGQLSWLGASTFQADRRSASPGDVVTYTIALSNDGLQPVTAWVSNTLPLELGIKAESIRGPGQYSSGDRELSWRAPLDAGEVVTVSYRAAVLTATAPAQTVVNSARIGLSDHKIAFSRASRLRIDAPDLSSSAFECKPPIARPGESVSCTLHLANTGTGEANPATARIYAPRAEAVVADSVWASAGSAQWQSETIYWSGLLVRGGTATLRFELDLPQDPVARTLYGVTFLEDGAGLTLERPAWIDIHPWPAYLPVVMKEAH
jgi:uncharacterized repeat protein (TIGR01451 family)